VNAITTVTVAMTQTHHEEEGTNMAIPAVNLEFTQPGPGGWLRLADHFPGALTPEYQRLYAETCPPGMAAYMSRYGVLARSLDVAFVQGHLYITPVPLAGARELRRTPPAAAVWLLARLHPEFRRRTRAARRALADRPWRAVSTEWFATERTQWRRRNELVQAIEPTNLTTTGLIDHLRTCRSLVLDGYRRHFELHGDDLLPIGLLIARCSEWGIDPPTAMRTLDGASPLSAGTVEPPAWQLITGYDLDSLAWVELPERPSPRPARQIQPLDLHALVAVEHHSELDRLVDDARSAVPLRDDNGALTGSWPMGLLRRAMLEAGRRLGLDNPTLAVELTVDELVSKLQGGDNPAAAEIVERRADRARRSQLDAPSSIGPEFAIPPLGALPRPLALMGAAQLASADHMLGTTSAGIGIGTRSHTGRALVVDDPATSLQLIEPGDVVITCFTSPSWNSLLVHAGALVTTTGGLVSHAAVIARELDIPAVIGDTTALTRFTTGTIVTVDPVRAVVRVVVAPPDIAAI
jgi:rifampicin phosphotransferase